METQEEDLFLKDLTGILCCLELLALVKVIVDCGEDGLEFTQMFSPMPPGYGKSLEVTGIRFVLQRMEDNVSFLSPTKGKNIRGVQQNMTRMAGDGAPLGLTTRENMSRTQESGDTVVSSARWEG